MINDYISSYKIQVTRDRIDERNANGQKLLCQIRLMRTVNKNSNLVDMDDLRCCRKQDEKKYARKIKENK